MCPAKDSLVVILGWLHGLDELTEITEFLLLVAIEVIGKLASLAGGVIVEVQALNLGIVATSLVKLADVINRLPDLRSSRLCHDALPNAYLAGSACRDVIWATLGTAYEASLTKPGVNEAVGDGLVSKFHFLDLLAAYLHASGPASPSCSFVRRDEHALPAPRSSTCTSLSPCWTIDPAERGQAALCTWGHCSMLRKNRRSPRGSCAHDFDPVTVSLAF